jgi:hypothetical protein
MNKQWIYRNGDKPFSVTEIVMPDGSMCFTSVHVQGFLMLHYSSGKVLEVSRDLDLIPYEPYSDYVIDDEFYVTDFKDGISQPAYWAGLDQHGKAAFFINGGTSFTRNKDQTIYWKYFEKANTEDK